MKLLYENHEPLVVGDHVEVEHCIGRYGQTRTVRGILQEMDEYGGIAIILDEGFQFTDYHERLGNSHYKGGDKYFICNAFEYDPKLNAKVGKGEFNDYEHGHTFYCRKL